MRTLILFMTCAFLACSGTQAPTTTTELSGTPVAKIPNPVSAPSADVGKATSQTGQEEVGDPEGSPPAEGPVGVEFTELKFGLNLPDAHWKVLGTGKGIFIYNEDVAGLINIRVKEDERPLKAVAQEEWDHLKASGQLELKPVQAPADGSFVAFMAQRTMSDGTKVVSLNVYLYNPSIPKQVLIFFVSWEEGDAAAQKAVLGILNSFTPTT